MTTTSVPGGDVALDPPSTTTRTGTAPDLTVPTEPEVDPIWYSSAASLINADFAYPGNSSARVADLSHGVVAGVVSSIEPGLVIQHSPEIGLPPTAFVNLVVRPTQSWGEIVSANGDVTIAILVDYSQTTVAAEVLESARVDPATVEDFPEEELGDVPYTYDDSILREAFVTRIDDAIAEVLRGQEAYVGTEIIAFVRSYDEDRSELEQLAPSDSSAAAALEAWPDRGPDVMYLTNPLSILTADRKTAKMRSIEDGAFENLAGLSFDRASEKLATLAGGLERENGSADS